MSHYRSFEARVTTLPVFLFFFTIYIIIQTPSESYTYSGGFITTTPKLAPVFLLRLFSFHSREALKKRKIKKKEYILQSYTSRFAKIFACIYILLSTHVCSFFLLYLYVGCFKLVYVLYRYINNVYVFFFFYLTYNIYRRR